MSRLGKFAYSTAAAVLAVDGGNSKTEVALVDAAGGVLGAARGPGTSHHHLGVPAAMEALEELVAAACQDAGLPATGRPLAEVGVWCLAGLDFPADDEALGPAVAGRRWAREALLHNDVFAVRRAGSDRTWGVGVVVGAGMNCVGVAPDGREVRFPAVGELSGDWGGGDDIGVAAVGAALRGEDGRGQPTTLTRLVPGWFGQRSALALVEALFLGRIER
ncbi:MAG TPA: BadF/BadG/BcrA/BcrD ATPase family protein, partial [Actinomycetes bacterium]|nr:BadF/BadG/BcrA/BcrD ATPase family protein [Actinomycetes bacterium]